MSTTKGKTQDKWGAKIDTQTKFLKTSELENGQSIEGTVIAFKDSVIPATGKKTTNVVFKLTSGETRTMAPSGNVAYAVRDGLLEVGRTYKITREGSTKIKGMTSGVFGIYPLREDAKSSDLNSTENDI